MNKYLMLCQLNDRWHQAIENQYEEAGEQRLIDWKFWDLQFTAYLLGIRGVEMHDDTLVIMSDLCDEVGWRDWP